MNRKLAVSLLLLSIAGCDGGAAPPPGPPAPIAQLHVGFGGLVDTIDVTAVERLPLRSAELLAPDGTAAPADSITVDPSPRIATGQWTVSNPWRDPLNGNSTLAALNLSQAQAGAALQGQEELLAMASSARIPLPDPVAYRRDWQNYRIRLGFGTPPGELEMQEVPAPAPPPR